MNVFRTAYDYQQEPKKKNKILIHHNENSQRLLPLCPKVNTNTIYCICMGVEMNREHYFKHKHI